MPRITLAPWLLGGLLLAPTCAAAHHESYWDSPGSLVSVEIEVEGRRAPLYAAPDGSGRFYLEAREGARYAVVLTNRTRERLAVLLSVDGLNAISGQRGPSPWLRPWSDPGRMYVLDPWDTTSVSGWRTSLSETRRFTFVDERGSYAARSGKANSKMGWIEVAVYREHRRYVRPDPVWRDPYEGDSYGDDSTSRGREEEGSAGAAGRGRSDGAARPAPPAMATPAPPAPESRGALKSEPREARPAPWDRRDREGYPGTGWGPRADDPAVVVAFEPEPSPAERITLRYEYRGALRALGILPRPYWDRDRLSERDRGERGFAPAPPW